MQTYIQYNGIGIPYTILRSKRKTVGIAVSLDKGVRVSAPHYVTGAQLQTLVASRADWIGKKLDQLQQERMKMPRHGYDAGEVFLYMGQPYPLKLQSLTGTAKSKASFDGSCISVDLPEALPEEKQQEWVRGALLRWYKLQAQDLVEKRIGLYSGKMGVSPSKVVIKEQKTLWGSCSGKNSIHINWKLVMAPLPVLDYVLVHELAHIKQKNHSKSFWTVVESILPGYREQVRWLKENGVTLML